MKSQQTKLFIVSSLLLGMLLNGCGSSNETSNKESESNVVSSESSNETSNKESENNVVSSESSNETIIKTEFITVLNETFNYVDESLWRKADWANGDPFYSAWCPEQVTVSDNLLSLTLEPKDCHGKTHASGEYRTHDTYKYGRYTVRFKASDVNGTISSFFTYTGSHEGTEWDEIDIEILGKNPNRLQVNYWRDGREHPKWIELGFDASLDMHTYSFTWHQDYIKWYVDNTLVHTVYENNLNDKDSLPINAGKIMLNLWAGAGSSSWSGSYEDNTTVTTQYKYVKYDSFK